MHDYKPCICKLKNKYADIHVTCFATRDCSIYAEDGKSDEQTNGSGTSDQLRSFITTAIGTMVVLATLSLLQNDAQEVILSVCMGDRTTFQISPLLDHVHQISLIKCLFLDPSDQLSGVQEQAS